MQKYREIRFKSFRGIAKIVPDGVAEDRTHKEHISHLIFFISLEKKMVEFHYSDINITSES